MSNYQLLSIISILLAALSLSYVFFLHSRYQQLRRDHQRTRLLGRMTDCSLIIRKILQDMGQYESFMQAAFGDNPKDIPDLNDTLAKIESLKNSFTDYEQETSLEKLQEATDHIEKVYRLMQNIANKSPAPSAGQA